MKTIIQLFAIFMIFSLIVCNLRRMKNKSKSKNKPKTGIKYFTSKLDLSKINPKTGNKYYGSQLDLAIKKISQKMCLKVGRVSTYIFFQNLKHFREATLPDRELFNKLFGNTFEEGKNQGTMDFDKIDQQIMFTAMEALGGSNSAAKIIPIEWQEYSKKMVMDNKIYLKRLVHASKSRSDSFKLFADRIDFTNKFIQNGYLGVSKEILTDTLNVKGVSTVVIEKIIEIVILLLQKNIIGNDYSNFFTDKEKEKNEKLFQSRLIKKNGNCGDVIPEKKGVMDYAPKPHYLGDMNILG